MRRPLIGFALSLALLAGAYTFYVVVYAAEEEDPPGWLLVIWLVGWGILALSVLWAIVNVVRSSGRGLKG